MNKCKCCKCDIAKNRKFCSLSCAAKINNKGKRKRRTSLHKINCIECNSEMEVETWRVKSAKFCSNNCSGQNKIRKTDERIESGKKVHPVRVKRYLLNRDGHKCQICKIEEWQGEPTPIVLDHIDGNPDNNDLNNFRLICPNCDHQTETFAGKNKKNPVGGRQKRMSRYRDGKTY